MRFSCAQVRHVVGSKPSMEVSMEGGGSARLHGDAAVLDAVRATLEQESQRSDDARAALTSGRLGYRLVVALPGGAFVSGFVELPPPGISHAGDVSAIEAKVSEKMGGVPVCLVTWQRLDPAPAVLVVPGPGAMPTHVKPVEG